jgi:pyruvate/2-oxoglutarate dehydrogenase complex dihydrolipoamide dehydrogenase (E3) component
VDEKYDVIAIGTSQGGRFLPVDLAKAGNKVALVERGKLGGVCVNTGCTPTKTMVASARLAYLARRGKRGLAQERHCDHAPTRLPG